MKKIFTLIIAFLGFFVFSANSQDLKAMQEQFLEAEYFFVSGFYNDALPIYMNLYEQMPDNANLAYRIGVCCLNINGKKKLSVEYLESAVKNVSSRRREGTIMHTMAPYDALFQLGNAYRVNYQFDKAKEAYQKYRRTLLKADVENISFVDHQIELCNNARNLISKPARHIIEPASIPLPEEKDNFDPVVSADGNTFVYMTVLPFYNAVMITTRKEDKWSEPENITQWLQPEGQIFVSSLSADGKTLFFSKSDPFNSDIYSITRESSGWSAPVKLNKNINTKYWESQAYITEDGNAIVFSSDRPGGYGGLDIYISYRENGDWGLAKNLGPTINTSFNEDRPALVDGGKVLFFTSQGHENIGGYDIFRSVKTQKGTCSNPENLGYPVNTPDDNIFYTPANNGTAAYISLYREPEGARESIYYVIFKF